VKVLGRWRNFGEGKEIVVAEREGLGVILTDRLVWRSSRVEERMKEWPSSLNGRTNSETCCLSMLSEHLDKRELQDYVDIKMGKFFGRYGTVIGIWKNRRWASDAPCFL
jgi:hypothetical protein